MGMARSVIITMKRAHRVDELKDMKYHIPIGSKESCTLSHHFRIRLLPVRKFLAAFHTTYEISQRFSLTFLRRSCSPSRRRLV